MLWRDDRRHKKSFCDFCYSSLVYFLFMYNQQVHHSRVCITRPFRSSVPQGGTPLSPALLMIATLGSPDIQALAFGRRSCRFWAAIRGQGIWENDFMSNYRHMSIQWRVPDFENDQYTNHLRCGKVEFKRLHEQCGAHLAKQHTKWRCLVQSGKRLAITLHWLSHSVRFSELARMYAVVS